MLVMAHTCVRSSIQATNTAISFDAKVDRPAASNEKLRCDQHQNERQLEHEGPKCFPILLIVSVSKDPGNHGFQGWPVFQLGKQHSLVTRRVSEGGDSLASLTLRVIKIYGFAIVKNWPAVSRIWAVYYWMCNGV